MDQYADVSSLPRRVVTAVGSLPHVDAHEAVGLILSSLKTAPHAPQLPRMDPREQMWIQFGEHIPRFRIDTDTLTYYFDTTGDHYPELEGFYEAYLRVAEGGESAEHFAVGAQHGLGIEAFLSRLSENGRKFPIIKVQVTGPLSFALTVTDETRKPIFYHPVFRDVAVKAMGLKAVWLLERFQPFGETIVVFFDEPGLSAYGSSAFLGVSKADVVDSLAEVMAMVTDRGGVTGVHCCGNTDWGMLMESPTRIINFDAVDYMESMSIYSAQLEEFLRRGGVLAWGAVCNDERAAGESASDVVARMQRGMKLLAARGVDADLLQQRYMVTPACGCANLDMAICQRVYQTLSELEDILAGDETLAMY
ncbi:MAG: hypothetical protein ACP5M0_02635 [Desulfomonilaceae bacterium]